jgi:hypothetical protein
MIKNKETVEVLDWKYQWSSGAPLPYVVSSGQKTFLIYFLQENDPNWNGTYVNVIDSASSDKFPLAVIEFLRCYCYKFGGANDEVFSGLPLYNDGLESYGAHIIHNSKWIEAEKKINKVHSYYEEEQWKDKRHYMLLFHDEMYECIAEGYKVETFQDSFENVVMLTTKRLFH